MIDHRTVDGSILRMKCDRCGKTFAHFQFEGEADVDTEGLCSASVCGDTEVAIIEALPDEWDDLQLGKAEKIEKRLALELGRDDFRILNLIRAEKKEITKGRVSFLDFKKRYEPPVMVYSCPCCVDGEARAVQEATVGAFKKAGGNIITVGRLTL